MKNLAKSFLVLAVLFSAIPIRAYNFSEANEDGVTIYYNIVSESNKTCEVTRIKEQSVWASGDSFTDYVGVVNIPSTAKGYQVIRIRTYAFGCCKGLTAVTIPNTVTIIKKGAFWMCSSLTSVTIPNSVTTIEEEAFYGCSSMPLLTIPASVSSIGENPFRNCQNLRSIEVDESNPYFNSNGNCNAIIETKTNKLISGCMNTIIPNTVKTIGRYAFYFCTRLQSITIPNSVVNIDNWAFYNCRNMTSLTIGNSVETIGIYAFGSCQKLTTLTIPNSVTTINDYAFDFNIGFQTVTIPKSVTHIGKGAFSLCNHITSITSYITDVFKTGEKAFEDCENATLYVPQGLASTYASTVDWNRFANIEEFIVQLPMVLSCNDRGKVIINGSKEFRNNVGEVDMYEDLENTIVFTPDEGCQLNEVLINGTNVTDSVVNNQLTTKILPDSKMIVVFSSQNTDVNGDGQVNINDIVMLVNIILGQ